MSLNGKLKPISAYLFHAVIAFMIVRSYTPFHWELQPDLLKGLLTGSHQGYVLPGSEMAPFKDILPPIEAATYLTDDPIETNLAEEQFFNDARLYLVPIVLNSKPEEKIAIVYCSSQPAAEKRLQETGYQWISVLSPGKGIAIKK